MAIQTISFIMNIRTGLTLLVKFCILDDMLFMELLDSVDAVFDHILEFRELHSIIS